MSSMKTCGQRLLVMAMVTAAGVSAGAPDAFGQRKKKDPAQEEKEAKDKKAYDLYQEGITHYNLGEFDPAIEKFKAAYALTGAPGLLFNVAQAYRLKKDYEQALYFYKTYLRLDPDAPNKGDVEARIAEMDKFIEEQKKMDKARPIGTIPPGGTGVPDPVTPPGGTVTPPGGTVTPPVGTTIAGSDDGGSDPGGSSIGGGDPGGSGISGSYTPKGGTLGVVLRADVDTATFKGAAFAVGASYAFSASFEAHVALLVTGKFGAAVGATILFADGKFRPLASLALPMFFDEGTHIGVHGAVGLRYDLSANLGLQVDLGVAHFLSTPNEAFTTTYFVPSLGLQGRL